MRERVLKLDLEGVIDWFSSVQRKLFEVDEDRGIVRIEQRLGADEAYVVELSFTGDRERERIVDRLLGEGFVEQRRRVRPDW